MTNNLYIPLKERAVLKLTGGDVIQFLQGLVTNDVTKTDNGYVVYALMLTPQGKFLYDFFIAKMEGFYLIDCKKENLPEIIKKFKMYKLRSDVQIEDVSNKYEVVSLIGDKVFELIGGEQIKIRPFCKGLAYIDPRNDNLFARSFIEIENNYQSFKAFDFNEGQIEDYNFARINAGVPEGGVDLLSQQSFPHDFGMNNLNAIDYNKGCYVGQEVTARVYHKGKNRKKLYVLDSQGQGDIDSNQEVRVLDEKVGTTLSATNNVALAVLFHEKVENNDYMCNINGMKIKVRS
jgi:folate-binding protein YgfZ